MNYKSRRSFLNANISIIAKKIAGEFAEVLITNEYYELTKEANSLPDTFFSGVSKISDTSAEMLYKRLLKVQTESNKFLNSIELYKSLPNKNAKNKEQNEPQLRQTTDIQSITENGEVHTQITQPTNQPQKTTSLNPGTSPGLPYSTSLTFKPITLPQRKAIIKITKYDFNWAPEATFSFILKVIPQRRKQLSNYELKNSKLNILYNLLTHKDADMIIKRLIKIKERNLKNGKN